MQKNPQERALRALLVEDSESAAALLARDLQKHAWPGRHSAPGAEPGHGRLTASPGSSHDRRDSYRLDLQPGETRVYVAHGAEVELRDLSATGSSLLLRGAGTMRGAPEVLPALIKLDDRHAFSADLHVVRQSRPMDGVAELGARFGTLTAGGLRTLSRFMIREFGKRNADVSRLLTASASVRITNPTFISSLLRRRARLGGQPMQVLDGPRRLPIGLVIDRTERDGGRGTIHATVTEQGVPLEVGREYTFLVAGSGAVFVFSSPVVDSGPGHAVLAIPGEVHQTGYREACRMPVSGSAAAEVAFQVTRVPCERWLRRLSDVTARGFSFLADPECDILFPGDQLSDVTIALEEGPVEACGIIRSIVPRDDGRQLQCGVELVEHAGSKAARRWSRFVFRQTYPQLRTVSGPGAEASWRILDSSGYVRLWTPPADEAGLHSDYLKFWGSPLSEVGHGLILDGERGPAGLAAGSLLYPRTWMLHHLSVDEKEQSSGPRRRLMEHSRQLIGGIVEQVRRETPIEFFVIYLEDGKRWNERIYGDFARRYFDESKLLYTPLRVYRASTAEPGRDAVLTPGGVTIVPANESLWTVLARGLERLGAIERAAFAVGQEEIDLATFSVECAIRGYERRRQALFAVAEGAPVAALVAETGDEGINIFGLLNTCRVFSLTDVPVDPAVKRALLAGAFDLYRAQGKRRFLFLDDDPAGTDELPPGLDLVSGGVRWLAHRDVMAPWTAYLDELFLGLAA